VAPLTATWASQNRTTAIRDRRGHRRHASQYRQTAADINPYIAMAMHAPAVGLYRIEHDRAWRRSAA
jgi:glutamine synthetase